ncbi:MAG TPA: response regulator transcription factor [Anaerolineales bacterium]|nr:response regulator transcription factor [Anaerolineales bacterium]
MPRIRVLLADDHAVLRAGLKALLSAQADMDVVGEAGDGLEALREAERLRPDVVLADVGMPGLSGLELTHRLKESLPEVRVLILTVHEDQSFLHRALRAGAAGYLVKRAAEEDLLAGIRAVARGEAFLFPPMTKGLIEDYLRRTSRSRRGSDGGETPSPKPYDGLTPREVQVLRLIAQGYSNAQVGEALVISVKTVESHRARIVEKLGLHSRVELVRYAVGKGLLE